MGIFTFVLLPTLQAKEVNVMPKNYSNNNLLLSNNSNNENIKKDSQQLPQQQNIVDYNNIIVKGDSSSPTTNPKIVISKEDIAESHATNLIEVLQNQPEITVVNNGGFGQNSLIHINGSSAQHIQLLLNGVTLNDSSNAQPFFDIGQIPLNFIESIEIITGSNSVKYGSGAIAGIININTIHSNKTMATINQSIGSFATLNTNAGINLHIKDFNIAMFGTLYNSKGYSVAKEPDDNNPLEDDASNIKDFNMNATYNINSKNSLELFYKANNSHADYDTFDDAYIPLDNPYNYTKKHQDLAYLKYKFNLFNNTFNNEITLASGNTKREYHEMYEEIPYDTYFNAQNQQLKYNTSYLYNSIFVINSGFAVDKNQALVSSYDDNKNTLATNMYISLQEYLNAQTFLEQGVSKVFFQHDGYTNTDTDSYYAYNLGLNYTNTSLFTTFKLNYGTAYRLPSIYELYATYYGNISLNPELSKGVNFSMNTNGFSSYVTDISLSLYYLKVDDLISFVENTYKNVGNYTNYGLDISSTVKFNNLEIVASYGYLNSNDINGKQAPLIPTHKATLNFLQDFAYINFNTQFVYGAGIIDVSTGEDIALDSYLIVNLITSYKLKQNSNLYFKIENLFNKDYVTSYGYSSSSRAYYMGILFNV